MRNVTVPFVADTAWESLLQDPCIEARRQELESGSVLFDVARSADTLYFIHRGQVRLYQYAADGSERLIEIFGAGEWVGAEALAGRAAHGQRAVAVGAATVTEVPAARLVARLGQHPHVAVQLVRRLAEKVQQAREDAGQLVFDDCNGRLLKTLLRFSASAAATPVEDGVVLHITHQQLAQAVGVARETVSLALTQLRQRKLLRTGRNRLMFDPEVLERFASRGRQADNAVAAQEPQ